MSLASSWKHCASLFKIRNSSWCNWTSCLLLLTLAGACSSGPGPGEPQGQTHVYDGEQGLVLALAVLGKNDDGSPLPLPAQMGILTPDGDQWDYRVIDDPESNAFHKVMAYHPAGGRGGLLSFGGTAAVVKLWAPDSSPKKLWQEDFGGKFSRMRDAEIGDIYGDGSAAIAIATHDQGVVAVLRPDGSGAFSVERLDEQPDTVVHEIEIGDMDGDGIPEIYATPSAPNKLDGTPQHGLVVRYIPGLSRGREEIIDLGDRHAKEILTADLNKDGRDELYVSVEAVSGGQVEIQRFQLNDGQLTADVVATLRDKLCRFLTVGDVDGDGEMEMVAATNRSGLWLLRPTEGSDTWELESIDSNSSGFEHASILLDLDRDGKAELYVASDRQSEIRRYRLAENGWKRDVILKHTDGLSRFTWNLMPAPIALLPTQ
ncbi:MAG: VCBS repeat-containing protein [Acidobacteriota bacterium]|nr:MAG: VCBS repeat-containing protein [Acidobacteriota bacterium]